MESVGPSTAEVNRVFTALSREINKASEDTTRLQISMKRLRSNSLRWLDALIDALNLKVLTKDQSPWVVVDIRWVRLQPNSWVFHCKALDLVYLTKGW